MKHANAIANFRQLCCLGLDAQVVMPSVLSTLHELIGSDTNSFYWATTTGDLCNVYFEQPMPKNIAAVYFSEFLNNPAQPYSPLQMRKYLRGGAVVGNSLRLFEKTFYNSDLYNLIWRPLHRRQLLWARVRDTQNRANGLALYRVDGDSDFTERDEQLLAQLVPYVAHALDARGNHEEEFVDSTDCGLMILDAQGRLRHQSSDARRLMLLAAYEKIAPDSVDWQRDVVLPAALKQLCEKFGAVFSGRATCPPTLQHHNAWGKFVFRAYPLEDVEPGSHSLIGVNIERHVPLSLALMQTLPAFPISAKQKEVCLLLARGYSQRKIADSLGVSPHTVTDHMRKIYDKLDVHSHTELLRTLKRGRAQCGAADTRYSALKNAIRSDFSASLSPILKRVL